MSAPSEPTPPPPGDDPAPPLRGPFGNLGALATRWLGQEGEGALIRRNTGWLLGDRAFRLGLGLFVNVWLVRYLGADDYGLMSFAQSIVVIFAVLSQLGLETIVVRELVRRPGEQARIVGSSIALRFAGAWATLGGTAAAAAIVRPGDGTALWLAVIFATMAFSQSLDVLEYWFQSRSKIAPLVQARMVAAVAGALMKVGVILSGASLTVIALVIALEYALSALALFVAFRRQPDAPQQWTADRGTARDLLLESWPLVLNSIAIVISVRVDQMMLTAMSGTTENGYYAAAQRLTEIIYYLPVALMAAANPILLRWHQRDSGGYATRLARVFSGLAMAGLAIAVVVSLLAGPIVSALFGAEFAPSGPVLATLAWNAPVVFLAVAQSNWFIAHGRQRGLMARSAVAAVLSVVLNLVLIPRFGARGAALTMVASQFIAHFLLNALFRETRGLFLMQCRALIPFGPR